MSPQEERLLLTHEKTPGSLASGGGEFNLGPEMRLDRSLLCNRIYIKVIEKAPVIDIRGGRKSTPLLVLAMELYTLKLVVTVNQKNVWRL